MKIALSAIGKFHTFDLARELYAAHALAWVGTGYPRFKLKNEGVPQELIHTFPVIQGAYMAFPWKHRLSATALKHWEQVAATTFASWVARNVPECDVYVGLSGSSLPAGKKVHQHGGRYVCDRGSSHIVVQDQLLREEHDLWGVPFHGVDPRAIAREEAEYQEADCITVPSGFVQDTFLSKGIAPKKLKLLPYGVNLSRFQPVGKPAHDRFDILFVGGMSLRKGVQYLVQAYQQLAHKAKSITFVGAPSTELIAMLNQRGLWPDDAKVLGHVPQQELKVLMSRSHILVLPSIEEGLAMVQAQAMACGCPVLATTNTGCADLFTNGQEGFIVPIRSVDALANRLQELADNPNLREAMGRKALARVQGIGGWRDYGKNALEIYSGLLKP